MNLLDCVITKIISGPYQKINDEVCCWEIEVEYNCYGVLSKTFFQSTHRSIIEDYKPGYTWQQ